MLIHQECLISPFLSVHKSLIKGAMLFQEKKKHDKKYNNEKFSENGNSFHNLLVKI